MREAAWIDGREVPTLPRRSILVAARDQGLDLAGLCHEERSRSPGSCRACLVRLEGRARPCQACSTMLEPGMRVHTEDADLSRWRRTLLALALSELPPGPCPACRPGAACRLHSLAELHGAASPGRERAAQACTDDNPFILRDPDRCIRCWRCVVVCRDVEHASALAPSGRGAAARLVAGPDDRLLSSSCTFCGQCVQACPSGALRDLGRERREVSVETERAKTTCPACATGCQLSVTSASGRLVGVEPADQGPPNAGALCFKGQFGLHLHGARTRLERPLVRHGDELVPASWDEALERVCRAFEDARRRLGPSGLAFWASAHMTNESAWLLQKLARAVGGTNSVDGRLRTSHAPSVAGLSTMLGCGAATNPIADLEDAELIFAAGTNATVSHPVIAGRILRAVDRGAHLVVVDPRRTRLAELAHSWLRVRPGGDASLYNALANVVISEGLVDRPYLQARVDGFDELRDFLQDFAPEQAEALCGVQRDAIRRAARALGRAKRAAFVFTLGVTQQAAGVRNVQALANLALLTGNIGVRGAGLYPLRGAVNVQGTEDMGCLPGFLPGWERPGWAQARERYEQAWGVRLDPLPGRTRSAALEAASRGALGFLHVVGENPMVSEPDSTHVREALERVSFLVVQDAFMTETTDLADVVLPAKLLLESEGTVTSTERRVQRVRPIVSPPDEARADWWILAMLLARLGGYARPQSAREVWAEVTRLVPGFGGLEWERLDHEGLHWPCPTVDHPGTPVLHEDRFNCGRARLQCVPSQPLAEEPDAAFPFLLTTGRRATGPGAEPRGDVLELCTDDAARLGLQDGSPVRVVSPRGELELWVRITERCPSGVAFLAHPASGSALANLLTSGAGDPLTGTAALKACAVRIEAL